MAHEPNIVFLVIYQNFNEEILEQFKENFNAPLYCNTKHLGIMFTELFGDNEVNYTNFRNCLVSFSSYLFLSIFFWIILSLLVAFYM